MDVEIHKGSAVETEHWLEDIPESARRVPYEFKKLLSVRKNIALSSVHVTEMCDTSDGGLRVRAKIIADRCATCLQRSAKLIGDCKYCGLKYCSAHRLPEVHACPEIQKCRDVHHARNKETLLRSKCVSDKV